MVGFDVLTGICTRWHDMRRTYCHCEGCGGCLLCLMHLLSTHVELRDPLHSSDVERRHPVFRCPRGQHVRCMFSAIFHRVRLAIYRDVAQPLSPCGICRQVIREFCALKMPILLVPAGYPSADNDVDVLETTVEGLLPYSFGPDALDLPRMLA